MGVGTKTSRAAHGIDSAVLNHKETAALYTGPAHSLHTCCTPPCAGEWLLMHPFQDRGDYIVVRFGGCTGLRGQAPIGLCGSLPVIRGQSLH